MADGILKVGQIQTSSGSGTITIGQSGETISIPSGTSFSGFNSIVGIKSNSSDSAYSSVTVNATVTLTDFNVTYTPQSTSNKLGFIVNIPYYYAGSATGVTGILINDGASDITNYFYYEYDSSNNRENSIQGSYWGVTPASTNSTTYTVKARTYRASGSNNINIGSSSSLTSFVTVIEYRE